MKPEIADNRQRASRADGCPLYVDLDGTLIATDMLWEALRALLRERPASIAVGPLWLTRGRARLKGEWAERLRVPVDMLPYRASVLAYIEQARANMLDGADPAWAPQDAVDIFYLRQRLRRWAGAAAEVDRFRQSPVGPPSFS